VLVQDALERAAVHIQTARGIGNIAAALFEHALDVFPAHAFRRHGVFRWRRQRVGFRGKKRGFYRIGVHRLCQIIHRAKLHAFHGGCDIAIGSHDHDAHGRFARIQIFHHRKAVAIFKAKVDQRVIR
jgi:hypothetical protein